MVRGRRNAQNLRPLWFEARPGLDAEVQLKLPINAVDPLVVPSEPFDVAEIGKAEPEAPTFMRLRQRQQPMGDLFILPRKPRGVAIAGLADPHAFAG